MCCLIWAQTGNQYVHLVYWPGPIHSQDWGQRPRNQPRWSSKKPFLLNHQNYLYVFERVQQTRLVGHYKKGLERQLWLVLPHLQRLILQYQLDQLFHQYVSEAVAIPALLLPLRISTGPFRVAEISTHREKCREQRAKLQFLRACTIDMKRSLLLSLLHWKRMLPLLKWALQTKHSNGKEFRSGITV